MSEAKHPRILARRWLRSAIATAASIGLIACPLPISGTAANATSTADAVTASMPLLDPATVAPNELARGDLGEGIDDHVTVEIAPDSPVVTPRDALNGAIVVRNRTNETLSGVTVRVEVGTTDLADRTSTAAWLAKPSKSNPVAPGAPIGDDALAVQVNVPELAPDARQEVRFTISADALAARGIDSAAIRPVRAQLVRDRTPIAEGHTVVTGPAATQASDAIAPYRLNVVVPVLAPDGDDTLTSAAKLEELTASSGRLTQLLDAVSGTHATLAIDPRLLISIRALGDAAPASAINWLNRLQELDNPAFPLEFADANLSLQQQAGLAAPLTASSFAFATNGRSFVNADANAPKPNGSAAPPTASNKPPSGSPTEQAEQHGPQDPAADSSAPSTAELQAFSYSNPNVVWPVSGTVKDVPEFATWASGGRSATVLMDGAQVAAGTDATARVGALQQVDKTQTIVTDDVVEERVEDVMSAKSDAARNAAMTELMALSTVSVPASGTVAEAAPTQVVTLPRQEVSDPARLGQVLDALEAMPQVALATLPSASGAAAAQLPQVSMSPGNVDQSLLSAFKQIEQDAARGRTLTSLYDVPEFAAQQLQVEQLRAISAQRLTASNTKEPVSAFADFAVGAWNGVSAEQGSEIQLIGHESAIPLFVSNNTDRRVTVKVQLHAKTGHLQFEEPVAIAVAPNSVTRAQIPVEAIANGSTTVSASVWTIDGVQLPSVVNFPVHINTNFETIIMSVMVTAVIGLLVVGGFRMRRRVLAARAEVTESVENEQGERTEAPAGSPTASEAEGTAAEGTAADTTPDVREDS